MRDIHEEAAKLICQRFPGTDIAVARGMAGAALEIPGALQFNHAAEAACKDLIAWFEAERGSPNYGSLTRDTHPEGEMIWREWYERNMRLCDRAEASARRALGLREVKS